MKRALLCLLVSTSVAAQEALPELPPPEPSTTEEAPPPPPPPKPKKAPRVKKRSAPEKVREAPPPPPPTTKKAPRRRVRKPFQPRPGVLDFRTEYAPLTTGERFRLSLAQGGCAVVGVAGTIATAAGAALLARAIDRPAGRLYAVPVQLGGLIPITVGMTMSGLATVVCVAGMGTLAERRIAGPAAAMAAWSAVALLGSTVALGAIFFPTYRSARNLSLKENVVAGSVVGMAVLAPLTAIIAYHAAAWVQQMLDVRRYNDDVAAAKYAIEEDRKKPAPAPPPLPVTTEPAPAPVPATPEPEPTPPPPPDVPAVPTTSDTPPVVVEEPVPAQPVNK